MWIWLLANAHADGFRSTQKLPIISNVVWNKRDLMFHSDALKYIIKVVVVISFTHPILTLNVDITSFLSHLCWKLSKRSHHTAQTIRSTYNNRLSHSPNNKNKLNYLSLTCTAHAHLYILTKAPYIPIPWWKYVLVCAI